MSEGKPGRLQILVVDDEPSVGDAARMMLEYLGHTVTVAHDGAEAVALFQTMEFDLVFTDFEMPGMKGDELAEIIKKQKPTQPIIMVTAYAEVMARNPAIDEVIAKPFLLKHLQEVIARSVPQAASQEQKNEGPRGTPRDPSP